MARPKKVVEPEPALPLEEQSLQIHQEPAFTHTALSVAKDKATGRWHVFRVKFDPSQAEKLGEGDDKSIVLERYKIQSAQEFFGDS